MVPRLIFDKFFKVVQLQRLSILKFQFAESAISGTEWNPMALKVYFYFLWSID